MSKKKRLIILLSVMAVIAAVIIIVQYRRHWSHNDPSLLSISGNIEVRDAEISFKIAGRVLERLVSEGELVKTGQIIARLDSLDLVQDVVLRQAELRGAQASLAELEAGWVCRCGGDGLLAGCCTGRDSPHGRNRTGIASRCAAAGLV